jgi:integrase
MPSIEPHAGGYRVRYREGGRGSKNCHTPTYPTKREAIQAMADVARMLAARKGIGSRAGTRLPFDQVVERWGNARPNADGDYVKEAKVWLLPLCKDRSWLSTADITPVAVGEWKASMGFKNGRRWAVLRSVLRWAGEQLEQPVDVRTLVQLRPKPGHRSAPSGLLPDDEVAKRQAQAAKQSAACGALVHCLARYGWRPVTAARMKVKGVDLKGSRIDLGILKGGNPWWHPLFPDTVERLRPLVTGRDPDAPLFTSPRKGEMWGERYGLVHWWERLTGKAGIYKLKNYALSAMKRGSAPWTRPLTVSEIQLFTGHKTTSQVLVYLRADVADLAEMMGCAPGVHRAPRGATKAKRRSA